MSLKHLLAGATAASVLSLCVVTTASADAPCLADANKYCSDVKAGGGALQACLEEHKRDISPACRKNVRAMKKELDKGQDVCGDDAIRLCSDVESGEGRVAKCLADHESELSNDCRTWMTNTATAIRETGQNMKAGLKRMGEINRACKADIPTVCAGVEEGEGRILECLQSNKGDVSEGCAATLN